MAFFVLKTRARTGRTVWRRETKPTKPTNPPTTWAKVNRDISRERETLAACMPINGALGHSMANERQRFALPTLRLTNVMSEK